MFIVCDNGKNRQMTEEEIVEQQSFIALMNLQKEAEVARADAKNALFERLGITADEAALLLA